jgi:hypothetical protein
MLNENREYKKVKLNILIAYIFELPLKNLKAILLENGYDNNSILT